MYEASLADESGLILQSKHTSGEAKLILQGRNMSSRPLVWTAVLTAGRGANVIRS